MKATEILNKLKQVFDEASPSVELEKVEEVVAEVKEETVLAEEVKEEVKEEVVAEQPLYATLSDLTSLKNEILDMLAQFAEVSKEYKKEVPSELSQDVAEESTEEIKEELSEEVSEEVSEKVEEVELSSEEPAEINHSPESQVETKKPKFKFSNRKPITTKDRVFAKLFNN